MQIGIAWDVLNNGNIGENWFVGPKFDAAGFDEAAAILNACRCA